MSLTTPPTNRLSADALHGLTAREAALTALASLGPLADAYTDPYNPWPVETREHRQHAKGQRDAMRTHAIITANTDGTTPDGPTAAAERIRFAATNGNAPVAWRQGYAATLVFLLACGAF